MHQPAVQRFELMQSMSQEKSIASEDFEKFISTWLVKFPGEEYNFLSFMLTGYLTSDWHGWDLKNEKWIMAWSLLPMKHSDGFEVSEIRAWWWSLYFNARGFNAPLSPTTDIHNLITDYSKLWGLSGESLNTLDNTNLEFGTLNRVAEMGKTIFNPTDMSFIGLMRLNDVLWRKKLHNIFDLKFHLRHFKCMQILFREFEPRERWMLSEYVFKEMKLSELTEKYSAKRFEFSELMKRYEDFLICEIELQLQQAALEERLRDF